jgi:pyruvate,water dikinase
MESTCLPQGMGQVFANYGVPMECIEIGWVNGHMYQRLRPLVAADKAGAKEPPKALIWLLTRVHPAFRARTKAAEAALATKRWRQEVAHWYEVDRSAVIAANLALQDEDPTMLDDAALADHLRRAVELCEKGAVMHFRLHGPDMAPIGLLLGETRRWGIADADTLRALEGSSPASQGPAEQLAELAALCAGHDIRTLDDVRACSPEASAALDAYLRTHGWRIMTSYDVEGRTLAEMPEALVASIRTAARRRAPGDGAAAIAAVRAQVPEHERAQFDELLEDARSSHGMRDDNGPITVEWPMGLIRRALLEAGSRLAAIGRIHDAAHVLEVEPAEATSLLVDGSGPTAAELAERAKTREAQKVLDAPTVIGPPPAEPPLDVMPAPLARNVRLVQAVLETMAAAEVDDPLAGTGMGGEPYVGTARVAHEPADALCSMEPGDILVAPFTTPAYNAVLAIAGAIVIEQGGALSHAAVMARELGIPAVIGASGAMTHLRDGDRIEVDPVAGRVRVVSTEPQPA